MKRTLVILTLNEIDGVTSIIPHLSRSIADEILAVDGGSLDGTVEFLLDQGIRVFQQDKPGRGEAFRVGMQNSEGNDIVFFSPDGNEDVNDIPKLFSLLESGADVAIASRFLPGARNEEDGELFPFRKWANQAFTWLANLLWNKSNTRVSDTINGFRGFRRQSFLSLKPTSLGFTIEYETTIKAMRARMKITEIPTVENHRIGGTTKGRSWPTGISFMRYLCHEIMLDIRCTLRKARNAPKS